MYRPALRRVLRYQVLTAVALVAVTTMLVLTLTMLVLTIRDAREGRSRPSVVAPGESPR